MTEIFLLFTTSTVTVLTLGFFLGLKHATEADHLAAVSTIVTERRTLFSSTIVGGLWGLGHTISLFVAGIFVILLNFEISEQTERRLEFCVGIMLFLLGLNVLRKIIKGGTLHCFSTLVEAMQFHCKNLLCFLFLIQKETIKQISFAFDS